MKQISLTDSYLMMPMDYTMDIQSEQRKNLQRLINEPKFSDVVFITGSEETKVNVNRALIAVISPVFFALLYGSMQESEKNAVIPLPDVDTKAFKCVVSYAYCNDPRISFENVVKVRMICDKYQISYLGQCCDKFVLSADINTSLTLLDECVLNKLEIMIPLCLQ
ncbi:hypothetical protein RFI_04094, partial [Reticulomyxa filosa]